MFGAKSKKQKIQARSSSEAELYALDDVLAQLQWGVNLMNEIGYRQDPVPLFQDNKSTIVMAEKGDGLDGRSKHIKARYFYVKHLIDRGVLKVVYLPTKEMVPDVLTKPMSGQDFRKFRAMILGEEPVHFGGRVLVVCGEHRRIWKMAKACLTRCG